ncbi:hypothetical protein [Rhodococcus sp. EPR-134]|uniref:hypothetical protein n=1 Tax=Rhodococcus sp. EPR-134 TaxID=1813675 RepID=UPI0012E76DF9|nr:hypothetical protein [Rhodococcus sp. EPR-134]
MRTETTDDGVTYYVAAALDLHFITDERDHCPDCSTPAILVQDCKKYFVKTWSQPLHDDHCPSLRADLAAIANSAVNV